MIKAEMAELLPGTISEKNSSPYPYHDTILGNVDSVTWR